MAETPGTDSRADSPDPHSPPMPAAVDRWEGAGGTWRIEGLGPGTARVALCRCDGGEVAEWLTLREPAELIWARAAAQEAARTAGAQDAQDAYRNISGRST
ncbi:hypothetical protein NQ038_12905 [Brevibacterium sp. 50QC2O2]|uniref:hypothetical protein n=1 Tax=Brevibacterium TaxID=1696 RepID=UPI00211D0CAE|nr:MULTISPECIES: hypothetical protein [unclassified Brevibacterium]MCQ9385634.1 hypothetical protein [Brevibacterium sp. 68QC2CO]MCQ9389537.1 hypothetical protein [Brevibacterium sp. 50QC2O2]